MQNKGETAALRAAPCAAAAAAGALWMRGYFKGLGMLPLIFEESEMAAGAQIRARTLCSKTERITAESFSAPACRRSPPLTAHQTHTQANNRVKVAAQPELALLTFQTPLVPSLCSSDRVADGCPKGVLHEIYC